MNIRKSDLIHLIEQYTRMGEALDATVHSLKLISIHAEEIARTLKQVREDNKNAKTKK